MKFRNKVLFSAIPSLLFLIIIFVIGEQYIRQKFNVSVWQIEDKLDLSYLKPEEKSLLWKLTPEKEGANSFGMKNEEVAEKKEGDFRILFLGDSLFAVNKTTTGERYTKTIEKKLSKYYKQVECINTGTYSLYNISRIRVLKAIWAKGKT